MRGADIGLGGGDEVEHSLLVGRRKLAVPLVKHPLPDNLLADAQVGCCGVVVTARTCCEHTCAANHQAHARIWATCQMRACVFFRIPLIEFAQRRHLVKGVKIKGKGMKYR